MQSTRYLILYDAAQSESMYEPARYRTQKLDAVRSRRLTQPASHRKKKKKSSTGSRTKAGTRPIQLARPICTNKLMSESLPGTRAKTGTLQDRREQARKGTYDGRAFCRFNILNVQSSGLISRLNEPPTDESRRPRCRLLPRTVVPLPSEKDDQTLSSHVRLSNGSVHL